MSFSNKIDEWVKEAEARPESALTIMKLIAKRLRELAALNEELVAENIALLNGTRVEEYQKRIAHLEYQLALLRRRFGVDEFVSSDRPADSAETPALNLLLYNAYGRILRIELEANMQMAGRMQDELTKEQEQPRLLGIPSNEEVLFLFTSGRVSTCAVADIAAVEAGGEWSWEEAALPDEPRAGEWLACIMPLARLPLSDYFLQVSRRGCVKKTMTSMAQSILGNRYLGKGTLQKADQPFDVTLCRKQESFAFVTLEGHLIGLDVEALSYSTEDRIRLTAADYVIASFIPRPDASMIFVTQTGKVIHRGYDGLDLSKSSLSKGQALIPPARLEQGIRFVGAASVRDQDQIVVLDATGTLTVYSAEAIMGAGSIEAGEPILSISVIPAQGGKESNS